MKQLKCALVAASLSTVLYKLFDGALVGIVPAICITVLYAIHLQESKE